jgi:hypothetical protein
MKFLFTLVVQIITVGFLLKLAVKLLVPRPIRKLFSKSTVALYQCSCEVLKELKENFEDDDDDVEYDDGVDDRKVITIVPKKRNKM